MIMSQGNTGRRGRPLDAVVIGAGIGGLYALKKLRDDLGLEVQAFDKAGGVGGTWYWNRYPGALSDTESHIYCYSWDRETMLEWEHRTKYVNQPEILKYLEHVATKHDLYRSIRFDTAITSAIFSEEDNRWTVTTDGGEIFSARYLITALGLLSATNIPKIDGIETFAGQIHHTSRWPQDADLAGKRLGVIGTGSTGVQLITAVAPIAGHLTVFQRSAQYSVPVANGPLTPERLAEIRENYPAIWDGVRNSGLAFGLKESQTPMASVSEDERKLTFDNAWAAGGGFRFMFETFCDIATNEEANKAAQDYIREKIEEIVIDPETARKLKPTDLYAKRPLCDGGYYQTFNRDNVTLVHIGETPIEKITKNGVVTADGVEHELDILIFATGFDAVDGNFKRIDLRGRGGVTIKDHWKDGPTSYLSFSTHNFPNMFMILGPNGPFTNQPPAIETEVEWISDLVSYLERNNITTIEPTAEAETAWTQICLDISAQTLFPKVGSWIFGTNIPGKKNTIYFYMGGLKSFRDIIFDVAEEGYRGFRLERAPQTRLVGHEK
jgi:cation diffusion facilitator CzcD-associated flavoprotein CzcO